MRSSKTLTTLLAAIALLLSYPLQAQHAKDGWEKLKVADGITLYTLEQSDQAQFVRVLKVNRNRKATLAYSDPELLPTSTFAENNQALAAVNAGFFDIKNGGSVTFLKVDGQVVSNNAKENPHITKSALVFTKTGQTLIESAASQNYYARADSYDDVIFTGPLLLEDGQAMALDTSSTFVTYRHPRTAACTLKKGTLLLLTVDGRNEKALGMSLPELTKLMQALKCRDAINLDGGGSTTMWVKLAGLGQVVNHPSDNKLFDNKGERKVANVILIK